MAINIYVKDKEFKFYDNQRPGAALMGITITKDSYTYLDDTLIECENNKVEDSVLIERVKECFKTNFLEDLNESLNEDLDMRRYPKFQDK
jgi:hypothetical protein